MILSDKFVKATDELCDFDNHVSAPYIRKSFDIDFVPEKAEITICGLGFYELYINGVNITKGALAPYISNTDDVIYYDNYDVAKYLKKGKNAIGVILGNGFRNPFGGIVWFFEQSSQRGPLVLALEFTASGQGESVSFEADESFKTHPSPIVFDELRMGCHFDSRLEIDGWNMPDFDDSDWKNLISAQSPKGEKRLSDFEPIVVTNELKPVKITHYDELYCLAENALADAKKVDASYCKDAYMYDFGVNGAGVTKLKINGKPGQKISIRHGEMLLHNDFTITNIICRHPEKLAKFGEYFQKDVFICKGGEEEFIPKFTYDGFRYALVEGLSEEQATADALTYLEMNTDLKEKASFNCSDETFNTLFKMARRSDLSNFYYFPTDCPHREKNGWTGDISLSAEHMLLNLTAEKSLKEYMTSVRHAQTEDGILPGIVPTGGWGFAWGNGPGWDAVCVNVPYYLYKYTGDKTVITDNKDMIIKYFKYINSKRDENGLIACGLGDWCDPHMHERHEQITAPLNVTDTVEIYDILLKASFMFEQIGDVESKKFTDDMALSLRNDFRKHLVDFDTMTVSGDCQTSQAMAVDMGIFNDDEMEAAKERLISIIHRDGGTNECGAFGNRHIFHALTKANACDLAYEMIVSDDITCLGSWIKMGETTLCEAFKPLDDWNIDSRNHHFFGDFISWMIQDVAGLCVNPDCDDVNHLEIRPHFIEKLSFANATYKDNSIKWERADNEIIAKIHIGKGFSASLTPPLGYTADFDGVMTSGDTEVRFVKK